MRTPGLSDSFNEPEHAPTVPGACPTCGRFVFFRKYGADSYSPPLEPPTPLSAKFVVHECRVARPPDSIRLPTPIDHPPCGKHALWVHQGLGWAAYSRSTGRMVREEDLDRDCHLALQFLRKRIAPGKGFRPPPARN